MSTKSNATELARKILGSVPANDVLSLVDQLDLRPTPGSSPVLLVPLRSLKQRRDVATFVKSAPVATASLLLEIIGHEELGQIIELLGENASQPTFDQLASAVDQRLTNGADALEVRAVLGHVIAESFPAAPHCERLLEERPELRLSVEI
jgi:predicted solute-binding protein